MTWQPLHGEGHTGPRRLRESLDRVARAMGTPGAASLNAVFTRWPEVVGAAVASHCRPLALSGGVLVVAVDDPAWATQLRYLGSDVLRRVEDIAGADVARRLEVRVRPPR